MKIFLFLVLFVLCKADVISTFDVQRCHRFYQSRFWNLAINCYKQGANNLPLPQKAKIYNLIGLAYYELQIWDDAKDYLALAINIDPNFADYYFNMGLALAFSKRADALDASKPHFDRATELAPTNARFAFQAGQRFFAARRFAEAEQYFRRGLQHDSNNAYAWNIVGVCAAEEGHYRRAVHAYRIAVALERTNHVYHWNLGSAIHGLKKPTEEMYAEAARHIAVAWEARPKNLDYILFLGNTYFYLHQYANATRFYDLAFQIAGATDPGYLNVLGVAKVNEFSERAKEADHHYLRIHPNTGRTVVERDQPYFTNLTELRQVESSYEQALDLNPDDAVVFSNRGNLAFGQDNFTGALHWFRRALDLRPHHAEYHHSIGLCHMELDEDEKAVAAFQKAAALEPGNVMHHFNLGRSYFNMDRFLEAADAFEAAARLEPDNANIHMWWGTALAQHGLNDAAQPVFAKAAALDPHMNHHHLYFDGALHSLGAEFSPPPNFTSPTR